jgi:hypothetical protein
VFEQNPHPTEPGEYNLSEHTGGDLHVYRPRLKRLDGGPEWPSAEAARAALPPRPTGAPEPSCAHCKQELLGGY